MDYGKTPSEFNPRGVRNEMAPEDVTELQHVVIRGSTYMTGSRDRPNVEIFTQTNSVRPPVPWGRLHVNDHLWMKWQGGPIVATGKVRAYLELAGCTVERLREATKGTNLYDVAAYWEHLAKEKSSLFFAVVVYTKDEEWISPHISPTARSYGGSWVVLDTPAKLNAWLSSAGHP